MDVNKITIGVIGSVAQLIDLSEECIDTKNGDFPQSWAFRGQPREYQNLTPSIQRLFSLKSRGTAGLIEQDLMRSFREHYAKLPDRTGDMPIPEHIAQSFDLRCLSVMQHYEVPTRLLDWTSDIWTSLYFACASEPGANAELWLYDRQIFAEQLAKDPSLLPFTSQVNPPLGEPPFLNQRTSALLVELDPRVTPRMRQQFAHHTVSADIFADHADLIDELQRPLALRSNERQRFQRYVIAAPCKDKCLRFLADHKKLTASTIFPDVVGLGRFLRWQLDSLRTMLL